MAKSSLGTCLVALDKFEEAEPLLLEGYTAYKTALGDADARTQSVIRKLVDFYAASGKVNEARKYAELLADRTGR